MNTVQIDGRVVWEPRAFKTKAGTVTNFVVEVQTGRGKGKSNVKCIAWESDVGPIDIAQGETVRVEGRLESRSYAKEGQKVEVTEVIASTVVKAKAQPEHWGYQPDIPF